GRGQPLPVGTEGHAPDEAGVSPERLLQLAGFHVPEFDRSIPTGRGQPLPVGAKRHAGDDPLMSRKLPQFLAGRRVPQFGGTILASGGQPLAVATECHPYDSWLPAAVTANGERFGAVLGEVPDLHAAILTGRGEALAVRVE